MSAENRAPEVVPAPAPTAGSRIRTAAAHPVVSPLVAEAMRLVADYVDGEWVTEAVTASATLTARRLLAYESERAELQQRLVGAEARAAELQDQLEGLLSGGQQARLARELEEARAANREVHEVLSEGMGRLFAERAEGLAEENGKLVMKVKALEAQLAEARAQLAAKGEGAGAGAGAGAGGAAQEAPLLRARKPHPEGDAAAVLAERG
jgi:hypothetical protein